MPGIRSTIVLFIIAVISVSAALYTWRNDALSHEEAEKRFAIFATEALPIDALSTVTLARRGNEPMVFERAETVWRQTSPIHHRMDTFSIRKFAVDAASLEGVSRIDPAEQSPESLGLEPPLATLTFEWDGGEQRIDFGRPGLGGRGYIRLGGDPTIYVVDRALHDRVIEMDPKEWRSRDLFEHASVDSISVDFRSATEGFRIERDRRKWQIVQPFHTRLDTMKTEEFLGRLEGAKLTEFILDQPGDLAQFGLDDPQMTFTITTPVRRVAESGTVTENVEERLLIGSARNLQGAAVYAMHEGGDVIFALSQDALAEMINVVPLIDLTASGVNPADVFAIRITAGEHDFTIERDRADPTQWIAPDFGAQTVDARMVDQVLTILTSIPASEIAAVPFDFEQQVGQFMLMGIDRQSPLFNGVVRISREPETGAWLLDNGETTDAGDTIFRALPESSVQIPLTPQEYGLR